MTFFIRYLVVLSLLISGFQGYANAEQKKIAKGVERKIAWVRSWRLLDHPVQNQTKNFNQSVFDYKTLLDQKQPKVWFQPSSILLEDFVALSIKTNSYFHPPRLELTRF